MLNIKNEEVYRLVSELAQLRGVSLTQAVKDAVQRDLEREKAEHSHEARFAEAWALAKSIASRLKGEPLPDHGEFLYDELGLPK